MARRRGAQFIEALTDEFPEVVVLAFWLNSAFVEQAHEGWDIKATLSKDGGSLLPGFVNGMLDALPPKAILVDAYEGAYYFGRPSDYTRCYNQITGRGSPLLQLVAPENLPKYLTQVQCGFGFFLDPHVNDRGAPYYFGGRGRPRLYRLMENLRAAVEVTDEYVWLWEGGAQYPGGRPHRWWPDPAAPGLPSWEQGMPGITDAIRVVRDPMGAARKMVADRRAAGELNNLAVNPGFEDKEVAQTHGAKSPDGDKAPLLPGFYTWQDDKAPKGSYSWDRTSGLRSASSVKVEGVTSGNLFQSLKVKPGDWYAVEARCLCKGEPVCSLLLRWKDGQGKWTHRKADRRFMFKSVEGSPWDCALGAARVPNGAAHLVVSLQTKGRGAPNEACWFDNLGVYRLTGVEP